MCVHQMCVHVCPYKCVCMSLHTNVCACVSTQMCVHECPHKCVCMCVHTNVCACMSTQMCVHVCPHKCVCMYVHTNVCACMSTQMSVHVCPHKCVCMCVHTNVCACVSTQMCKVSTWAPSSSVSLASEEHAWWCEVGGGGVNHCNLLTQNHLQSLPCKHISYQHSVCVCVFLCYLHQSSTTLFF